MNLSVRIGSGENNPPHHASPLLIITSERPEAGVLDAMMRPYLDDPPWVNKTVRIIGYTLGGRYRGWLKPQPGAEALTGSVTPPYDPYIQPLLQRDGVDAVRICDLQSASPCWERWGVPVKLPRQRKPQYRSAPRCDVLVARAYAKSGGAHREYPNDPWWDCRAEHADRPHARWLKINEGSCDDERIPALIAQVPSTCWLAVIDYWTV